MRQWRVTVHLVGGGRVTPHGWADDKHGGLDRPFTSPQNPAGTAATNYGRAGVWDGSTFWPSGSVVSVLVEIRNRPDDKPRKPKPEPKPKPKPKPKPRRAQQTNR